MLLVVALALAVGCRDKAEKSPPAKTPAHAPVVAVADAATGPVLQARVGAGSADEPPHLAFTVTAVHEGEQPSDEPPWHEPGGDWTFLDAATAGGVPFVVGLHEERRLHGDIDMVLFAARLGVLSREDGARFVGEYAHAFGVAVPPPGVQRPIGVLTVSSVVLGEHVGRGANGFAGAGPWVASKWTSERGDDSAEVFFNYDLDGNVGEFSQKDADYDETLVAHLAAALRDGAPPTE